MKDTYGNKMIKKYENKEVPQYVGGFSIWLPTLNKKVNPGDKVPEFSLEEAKRRDDFIIIKE
jgi:hypothetical protein